MNEDEEEDTENESDASEGLSGLHSGPSEGLPDVQREAELRGELLARRQRPLGPVRWPLGPERWPLGPERPLNLSGEERGEARARGEFQRGAEAYHPMDPFFEGSAFEGPDLRDAEVRAAVGFLTSTFKIPSFNPEAPEMWIESVSDGLYSVGMSAVFQAADCRDKDEVPVRVRNAVELIPPWKQAFVWTAIRRSLQTVPAVHNRTQRGSKGNVEVLIRSVLDYVQKRSQGLDSRLRDEVAATTMADYPSLRAYISDMESKFHRMVSNGIVMTDREQRHLLLRGLTPEYNGVKASILTFRNRFNKPAELADAISIYADNTISVTRTINNREVTLTTVGGQFGDQPRGDNGAVCFNFSKKGNCRRGRGCKFRHVERPTSKQVSHAQGGQQKRQKVPSEHYRRSNTQQGKRAGKAQKTGACHNCGKQGHWARECRAPKVERNNMTSDWASTTFDFVRAGNIQGLDYIPDRWLVDSASTCLVANECFPEFFNLRAADISIRVGGGSDLPCSRIGDLWVKGVSTPILLVGVRIVPGFGVNILSGPYLEQKLGMALSSNGLEGEERQGTGYCSWPIRRCGALLV